MLKQRVITALVLVAIMFGALAWPGPWPFALVSLALFAAGAWEWGRLNQASDAMAVVMGLVFALVGAGLAAGFMASRKMGEAPAEPKGPEKEG